jgi:hypothetical protein
MSFLFMLPAQPCLDSLAAVLQDKDQQQDRNDAKKAELAEA